MTCVGSLRQLTVGVRGSACKTSPLFMERKTNDCAVVKLSKGEVCETGKQLIKIHVFCMFYGPSHYAFTSSSAFQETVQHRGALNVF